MPAEHTLEHHHNQYQENVADILQKIGVLPTLGSTSIFTGYQSHNSQAVFH